MFPESVHQILYGCINVIFHLLPLYFADTEMKAFWNFLFSFDLLDSSDCPFSDAEEKNVTVSMAQLSCHLTYI